MMSTVLCTIGASQGILVFSRTTGLRARNATTSAVGYTSETPRPTIANLAEIGQGGFALASALNRFVTENQDDSRKNKTRILSKKDLKKLLKDASLPKEKRVDADSLEETALDEFA